PEVRRVAAARIVAAHEERAVAVFDASRDKAADADVNRRAVLDADRPWRVVVVGASQPEERFENRRIEVAEAVAAVALEDSGVAVEGRRAVAPLPANVDELPPVGARRARQASELVQPDLERADFVRRCRDRITPEKDALGKEVGVAAG